MRVLSVNAQSFGRLRDSNLDFAGGLNILYGPNESCKSTWHAAIFLGLCGLRRGPGRLVINEDLTRRHRPWDGDEWKTAVTIQLGDGRRVEIDRDLDLKTASVIEVNLGRNVEQEIIYDGAADAARWLGLTRDVFPSIALVRQAQVANVSNEANALQEYLQRAAATYAGTGTAAKALERIVFYRKVNVGLERANSRRPLQRAIVLVRKYRLALEKAREALAGHEQLVAEVAEAQLELDTADRECRRLSAIMARAEAKKARERKHRAVELAGRHPAPPPGTRALSEKIQVVTEALGKWRTRPDQSNPPRQSVAELEAQLAELVGIPDGPDEVDEMVLKAAQALEVARRRLKDHETEQRADTDRPLAPDLTAQQLRKWAEVLREQKPEVDSELVKQQEFLKSSISTVRRRQLLGRTIVGLAGVAALTVGTPVWALGFTNVGVSLVVAGTLLLASTLLRADRVPALIEQLRAVEGRLGNTKFQLEQWQAAKERASQEVQAANLSPVPEALESLAKGLEVYEETLKRRRSWEMAKERIEREFKERQREACALLQSLGAELREDEPVERSLVRYRQLCRSRSTRRDLQTALEKARHWEAALAALGQAAARVEVVAGDAEALATELEAWRDTNNTRLSDLHESHREWQELQRLLDEKSMEDLEVECASLAQRADDLASQFDPGELKIDGRPLRQLKTELESLRKTTADQRDRLTVAKTRLESFETGMPSLSECEESLERAEQELERVQSLARVLDAAKKFLSEAQERVHRNISPILCGEVERWMPSITGGRYVSVRIDPETLNVQVRENDGNWRQAELLSHGTAEQVYLLLRVAMASYLSKKGETCPLILDDVTVQADSVRTRAILEALKQISRSRQVILFSQEDEVREWAQKELTGERDRYVELTEA